MAHPNDSLADFYASIVDCPNTAAQCPGTINNPSKGHAPRGFYFEGTPGNVDLLLVGKNPGHPIGAELTGVYAGLSPAVLSRQVLGTARRHFRGDTALTPSERRSSTFHENLRRYVCEFLDIAPSEIFKRCAYTNLVKCSTVGEQDRLHKGAMQECFVKHLVREMEFLRPKVIVALGREVQQFLMRPDISEHHRKPVVYVKHPSYHYRADRRDSSLARIKAEIRLHLR